MSPAGNKDRDEAIARESEEQIARQGRVTALVIAGTMLIWLAAPVYRAEDRSGGALCAAD